MWWTQYIAFTSHVYNILIQIMCMCMCIVYLQQTFIILLSVLSALYYCALGSNRGFSQRIIHFEACPRKSKSKSIIPDGFV